MTTTDAAPPETDDGAAVADPSGKVPDSTPAPSSLAGALARLQARLPRIAKIETGKVEGTTKDGKRYSYEYKYADLSAISAAVLPLLGGLGLAWSCRPTYLRDPDRFVLAYSLLHEGGERIDGEYPLQSNVTPQALGSAITYGRRYCLCAVTGVAPEDDDDDAAAAQAQASQFRQAQPAPGVPRDVAEGRERVKAAWSVSFGWGDRAADECAEMYGRWSEGRRLWDADAPELRRFAAYLSALPAKYAGDDPADVPATASAEGQKPEGAETVNDDGGPKLTAPQRTTIQAALAKIYGRDRKAKLEFLSGLVGRVLESSNELTVREASDVINALKSDQSSAGEPGGHAQSPDGADGTAPDRTSGETRPGEPDPPADPTTTQGEDPTS